MKIRHALLPAVTFCGLSLSLAAQTAPATSAPADAQAPAATPAAEPAATPAAAAPEQAAAPQRAPRAAAPQPVGGIQADSTKSSYKFYFGTGDAPAGFTKIAPDMAYNDERGFGFDRGATAKIVPKDKSGKTTDGVLTADKLFFLSTALPEGNYKVTVTLGNPDAATDTSVKAELRRLMLENVTTKPGEYVTKTFIVNTRRPGYPGGEVRLKAPRESMQEAWDWDKGLTLEFNGENPSVAALEIEKVDNVPTVYVVGDSTSCDQMQEPYNSWGQTITRFFKPDVAVANHGESGETVGDNLGRQRFDKIWSQIKPGDYVFVTSGHNERNGKNNNMTFDQRFYDDCKRIVEETRQRGGITVFVSPISRAPNGPSLGPYPGELKQVADEEKVAFIDLQEPTATFYRALPDYHVAFATPREATHNSDYGSYEVSKMIVTGIRKANLPLAKSIVDGFTDFDPAKPDPIESLKVAPTPLPNAVADHPPGS